MSVYWFSKDEDYDSYEAVVKTCVRVDDVINITFIGNEDGYLFEGRISIPTRNSAQAIPGFWRYPDAARATPRFTDASGPINEQEIRATVTGRLNNFRGTTVSFIGKWEEQGGPTFDFEIAAKLTS